MSMVYVGTEPQLPKLFVDPPTYIATQLGEVFTVDINISNVQSLIEFELKLGYNTTLLDALDAVLGSFPFPPAMECVEINETEGYVWVYVMCWPVTGNGTLATVTFKATCAGPASCALDLYNTEFEDINTDPIYPDVENGSYEFIVRPLTVATDKPYYLPGETVEIHGNLTLTLGDSPYQGLMTVEVDDPLTNPLVVRTLQTSLTLPPEEISILGVIPCDMWGNPKTSFKRDPTQMADFFYVKVTVKNNDPTEWKNVVITADIYDVNNVSLRVGASGGQIYPGPPESHVISIYIPEWASVGDAVVYANAFNTWPGCGFVGDRPLNGIPYCPEENATFQITDGGKGATALEAQSSGNNSTAGNYSLSFKLPPDARAGIYRVYAVSLYQERSAAGSGVFGVNAIYVPDHYLTIQAAVDAATSTNKSILVLPGTYNEHVTINKSLRLVGIDPSNTIIDGSETDTVVTATADNVEISRFTIQNGGSSFLYNGITLNSSNNIAISENTILKNYHGIHVDNSNQGNVIRDNTITSNNGYGINIHSSSSNDILDNTLSNNNYGIYLNHSAAITLRDNNMVCNKYNFGVFGDSTSDFTHTVDTSNTVDGKPIIYWINQNNRQVPSNAGFVAVVDSTNITVRDLYLTGNGQGLLFVLTTNSRIENVNTTSNDYGIYLANSYGNTLISSTLSNNTVSIYQSNCNENIICRNNFINNTNQVELYESSNTWNDGAGRGNYWDDYTGEDVDADGVGDTLLPHQGVDWYPLMNPFVPTVHDVAVISVTSIIPYNASHVYPGWVIGIIVTAKNKGDFAETFTVKAYYNETLFDTKTVTLFVFTSTTLNFMWNTIGVSPGDSGLNYTIKAEASVVSNETNTADNALIDGVIQVNLIGDVDNNGKVSVRDIILCAINLGDIPPSPPECDIDGNGNVTVRDIILCAINMG
jgi:parallel beta-helix repeat protein